jgi:NADPH-dependent curcumin reductase CurA
VPRQIVLASRPSGWPTEDNFAVRQADRPELADGQVRVRNQFMSVDPYMRGRMNDTKSYVPPFQLGEPLEGGAIGSVTESRSPDLAEGDLVLHNLGWRDEAVLPARHAQKVSAVAGLSPSAYLGVLGMTALTAYVGLLDVGFIVSDHRDRMPDMIADISGWLSEGKLFHTETVVEGLQAAPSAFINLLRGHNTGKMIVRL